MTDKPSDRPLCVLVVDDDDGGRFVTEKVIREGGYEVYGAGDAASALAQLAAHDIDLMLTDVQMPQSLGGFALARVAKKQRPGLAVLFITSYDVPADLPPELKVLKRPIQAETLLAEIRAAIRRG